MAMKVTAIKIASTRRSGNKSRYSTAPSGIWPPAILIPSKRMSTGMASIIGKYFASPTILPMKLGKAKCLKLKARIARRVSPGLASLGQWVEQSLQ